MDSCFILKAKKINLKTSILSPRALFISSVNTNIPTWWWNDSLLSRSIWTRHALLNARAAQRKKVDQVRRETLSSLSHDGIRRRQTISPFVAAMKQLLIPLLWQSRSLVDLEDFIEKHFAWSWGGCFHYVCWDFKFLGLYNWKHAGENKYFGFRFFGERGPIVPRKLWIPV